MLFVQSFRRDFTKKYFSTCLIKGKICEDLSKCNNNKTKTQFRNWTKDLNTSPKKIYKYQRSTFKDAQPY